MGVFSLSLSLLGERGPAAWTCVALKHTCLACLRWVHSHTYYYYYYYLKMVRVLALLPRFLILGIVLLAILFFC